MKKKARPLLVVAMAAVLPPQAAAQKPAMDQGWSVSVGAGVLATPSYLGDDAYQLRAVPNIKVTYGDSFFASIEGIGYRLIDGQGWRAGPIVKYDFGRDEDGDSPFLVAGDKTDDLNGLGDVDGTVEVGGFVEYGFRPFTAKVELRQGIGGHEGLVGEVGLDYGGRLVVSDQMVIFSIGPDVSIVDQNYNEAFFGVDAGQSAASGLDAFEAGGGVLSYGVGGTVIIPFTDKVSAVTFARYQRLAGDAADSSLVQDRGSENQGAIGLFLNYRF